MLAIFGMPAEGSIGAAFGNVKAWIGYPKVILLSCASHGQAVIYSQKA